MNTLVNQEPIWQVACQHLIDIGQLTPDKLHDANPHALSIALADRFQDQTGQEFTDENIPAFTGWLEDGGDNDDLETNLVQFARTFNVAHSTITITVGSSRTAKSHAERAQIIRALNAETIRLYADVLNHNATTPVPAAAHSAPSAPAASGGGASETLDITSISKNVENGVTKIRAHGGKWKKFGVALYPEAIMSVDSKNVIKSLPVGETSTIGSMKIELKADGKPHKVSEIFVISRILEQAEPQPGW